MDKKRLKILSLIMTLNFLIAFCRIENCSAQSVISGSNCNGVNNNGDTWTCFTNFSSTTLPYTLPIISNLNCHTSGTGESTGTIITTVPVQISYTNGNMVEVWLKQSGKIESGSTIPVGTNTLIWATIADACNFPTTFTFSAVNVPGDPKGKLSPKKK